MATQLNQNTTDLQSILDTINALPDAGYDKAEVDAAIEDIATAIEGKGVEVPSGTTLDGMAALIDGIETGNNMVSVTYSLGSGTLLYFGEDNKVKQGYSSGTLDVNSGIVFIYGANTGATLTCSGDYIVAINRLHQPSSYNCALVKFLSDGGTITVAGGDGGSGN